MALGLASSATHRIAHAASPTPSSPVRHAASSKRQARHCRQLLHLVGVGVGVGVGMKVEW